MQTNTTYQRLPSRNSQIYIATRLYNYIDKIHSEEIETAVLQGVAKAASWQDIPPPPQGTFVPYRDTNEHLITADNKAIILYQEDIKRLAEAHSLVALFDGLSKDEGISFEIGYAFSKNVPIILLVTDFFHLTDKASQTLRYIVDPVIERMTSILIHEYHLSSSIAYSDALQKGWMSSLVRLEESVRGICANYFDSRPAVKVPQVFREQSDNSTIKVFCDFGGGLFQWQRNLQQLIVDQLGHLPGVAASAASRYIFEDIQVASTQHILGLQDLQEATSASVIVVCHDMDEAVAGTAAIQGLAAASGKPIILYDSRSSLIRSDDGLCMSRNLMLDQSATVIVNSVDDIDYAFKEIVGNLKVQQ